MYHNALSFYSWSSEADVTSALVTAARSRVLVGQAFSLPAPVGVARHSYMFRRFERTLKTGYHSEIRTR